MKRSCSNSVFFVLRIQVKVFNRALRWNSIFSEQKSNKLTICSGFILRISFSRRLNSAFLCKNVFLSSRQYFNGTKLNFKRSKVTKYWFQFWWVQWWPTFMNCPFLVDYSQLITMKVMNNFIAELRDKYNIFICSKQYKQKSNVFEQAFGILQPKQIYAQKVWILSARGGDVRLI